MLTEKVTTEKKKKFIGWLLNNYSFRRREIVWILNYLSSHDTIMDRVKFVFEGKSYQRGNALVLSTNCIEDRRDIEFFIDGELKTRDPEDVFHKCRRLLNEESLYLEIQFSGREKSERFYEVLEDDNGAVAILSKEDKREAVDFLNHCIEKFKIDRIKADIDEALDNGDKERFEELSKVLKEGL